jgi:hypothetical protein
MDHDSLRLLIREKLADGRLPRESITEIWGGPSTEETCGACDKRIERRQSLIEGIDPASGRTNIQVHAQCFYLWDAERDGHGR